MLMDTLFHELPRNPLICALSTAVPIQGSVVDSVEFAT